MRSDDTENYLNGIFICSCNTKPCFDEEIGDAIIRRLVEKPFESKFVDCEEEFCKNYKIEFLHILLDYYKMLKNRDTTLTSQIDSKEEKHDYLKDVS